MLFQIAVFSVCVVGGVLLSDDAQCAPENGDDFCIGLLLSIRGPPVVESDLTEQFWR